MKSPFTTVLYRVPSVQWFLDRLVDDLVGRQSMLVLLPVTIGPAEVWSQLRVTLRQHDVSTVEVALSSLPEDCAPALALAERLQIQWPPDVPQNAATLASLDGLPDVIYLSGLDRVSANKRKDFISLLTLWSRASQNITDLGRLPTALCVVAKAPNLLEHLPESDVRLAIHWWWGFPSELETHLLCRLAGDGNLLDAESRWREHVLPALAGNDISLVHHLWDSACSTNEKLLDSLSIFAEQRNWSRDVLEAWGVENFTDVRFRPSSSPPVSWRDLWAQGAVHYTVERGPGLHSAALAVLGRRDELLHRVWRGQSELLLPRIDQVRLIICDYLTQRHGPDWPLRWDHPASWEEQEAVKDNPLACGLGYLEHVLGKYLSQGKDGRFLPLIRMGRSLRNEISHYRPIPFQDYKVWSREIERVSKQTELYL